MFKNLIYLYGLKENMVKKAGWFVFFALLASSCLDEPECFSLNNNIVGISFRRLSTGGADTVFFKAIRAEGTDSVFVENAVLTNINLPLNYYQNQTIYRFEGLTLNHTLQLDYTAKAQFVSVDCGERFILSQLRPSSETFDSLRLIGDTPKRARQNGTNLEIYRCPNTSQVELRFAQAVKITSGSTMGYTAPLLLSTAEVTTLAIPLNIEADESTIRLSFDSVVKTITISYSRSESTLFSKCGPQTVLSDFQIVSSDFTSARVIRSTIQDPLLTNIEITF